MEEKSVHKERNLRIKKGNTKFCSKETEVARESRESSFVYDCCKTEFFTIDNWNFSS